MSDDDDLVKQSIAELQDLVRCRCHEAYKGRGLHDPTCCCDYAEALKVVSDRIEDLEAQVRAADALADAHGKLWSALAEIIEAAGMLPNATVGRMAERAEKALVEDTIADLKPVPRFYKKGGE